MKQTIIKIMKEFSMTQKARRSLSQLWHNPSEEPDKRKNIIVLTTNGRIIDNREKVNISYSVWFKFIHAKKWCYLSDFIPE